MTDFDHESDDFLPDRFRVPVRANAAARIGALIVENLREAVKDQDLTDGQKEYVASAGWFEPITPKAVHPFPLLGADAFSIGFLSGHDETHNGGTPEVIDGDRRQGNRAIPLRLFKDGSPFIFDEDFEVVGDHTEYTLLAGPDAPPVVVNQAYLEEAMFEADLGNDYAHGSWTAFSLAKQKFGAGIVHELSDQDCESLFQGILASDVDIEQVIWDFGRSDPAWEEM